MSGAVKKGWEKVDGYKTKIGVTLAVAAVVLPEVVKLLDEWGADPQYAAGVGVAITVVGAAHKIWKKYFGSR